MGYWRALSVFEGVGTFDIGPAVACHVQLSAQLESEKQQKKTKRSSPYSHVKLFDFLNSYEHLDF